MTRAILVKKYLSSILSILGVVRWHIRSKGTNANLILMYHRVVPRQAIVEYQPGMFVQPKTLDLHVRTLQRYFSITSLAHCFAKRFERGSGRPLCALTFDDGWADFRSHAFPVLRRHAVPATVFLPTNYIGTGEWFWTDRLACLFFRIRNISKIEQNAILRAAPLLGGNEIICNFDAQHLESTINTMKQMMPARIDETLKDIERHYGFKPNMERAFMTWKEVKGLYQTGLVEFGSHSCSHRILTSLSSDQIEDELVESRRKLLEEKVVSRTNAQFCYPNGSYNRQIIDQVKNAGYELAVTTESGWMEVGREGSQFAIPRVAIHEDIGSTKSLFLSRVAGLF